MNTSIFLKHLNKSFPVTANYSYSPSHSKGITKLQELLAFFYATLAVILLIVIRNFIIKRTLNDVQIMKNHFILKKQAKATLLNDA